MSRKVKDNSPRFDRNKSYAIGILQGKSLSSDVPDRFAMSPVKPLYLSGTDLIGAGMKSCRDFLLSKNCHFRIGSAVHFYEVEYGSNNDAAVYKNIFIGSPLASSSVVEQGLSDKADSKFHTINNIIPSYSGGEYEKLFFKSQSDAIVYYQQCLQDARKEFANERSIYSVKLQEQNDKILELNLQIHTLKSLNDSLQIRYEELNKYSERLSSLVKNNDALSEVDVPSTDGLGDRAGGFIKGILGDEAAEKMVLSIMSGIGSGVDKLIGLGVDYVKDKGLMKSKQPPNTAQPVPSLDAEVPVAKSERLVSEQATNQAINTAKYNQELGWSG